eukprot:359778-Chlamydomonas_euryale.AAC.1
MSVPRSVRDSLKTALRPGAAAERSCSSLDAPRPLSGLSPSRQLSSRCCSRDSRCSLRMRMAQHLHFSYFPSEALLSTLPCTHRKTRDPVGLSEMPIAASNVQLGDLLLNHDGKLNKKHPEA